MASASLRISTLCLALVISAGMFTAHADEESVEGLPSLDDNAAPAVKEAPNPPPPPVESTPAGPEVQMQAPPENPQAAAPAQPGTTEVPTGEIDAKAYDLKTVRPSRSGRVYLFEKSDAEMPQPGKIVLLRDGSTPVMAFRVLKTYPDQKRIAMKKLRAYPNYDPLARGSTFRAFEKVGDIMMPVPPTKEDMNDIQELETSPEQVPPPPPEEVAPVEPENLTPNEPAPTPEPSPQLEELAPAPEPLPEPSPAPEPLPAEEPKEEAPAEPAPTPEPTPESEAEAPKNLYPSEDELEVKEHNESDELDEYYPNQFSMNIGFFSNGAVPGPKTKFTGGLSYGRLLSPSFLIEGSLFYYKSGDSTVSMTIIPMIGTIQWLTRINPLVTGYLFGGVSYPYVASNVSGTRKQLTNIQVPAATFGLGAYLQTGPNWYLRGSFGFDIGSESDTTTNATTIAIRPQMIIGVMLRY